MSRLNKLIPDLRYDHPNLFLVTIALLFTHVALAVDGLLPGRHATVGWAIINSILHHTFWIVSIFHVVTVLMIVIGLYWNYRVARWGFLLSVVIFNTLGFSLFAAGLLYGTSFFGAIAAISLSMISIAAFRSPKFSPTTFLRRPGQIERRMLSRIAP